jgi:hypothetical protein
MGDKPNWICFFFQGKIGTEILAFAGSPRRDSFNKKSLQVAATRIRNSGADVTVIDLKDFPMPLKRPAPGWHGS